MKVVSLVTVIAYILVNSCITEETGKQQTTPLHRGKRGKDRSHECHITFWYNDIPLYDRLLPFELMKKQLSKTCIVARQFGFKDTERLINTDGKFGSTHFIYPVIGKSSEMFLQGYLFTPVVTLPNMIYVTPKHQREHIIVTCLRLYPLFIMIFLMILVFGGIYWMVNTKENHDESPKKCFLSWMKGIWLSSVSIITMGLVNKPKSILAQVLSVIWISCSVIMISLLTGLITVSLIKPSPIPTMNGARVGALRYPFHDHFHYVITTQGGRTVNIPRSVKGWKQLYVLMKNMYDKKIDGILLDRHTLNYALKFNKKDDDVIKYFRTETIQTYVRNDESMSVGFLTNNKHVSTHFYYIFRSCWHILEMNLAKFTRNDERQNPSETDLILPFSQSDPYGFYAIVVLGSILLFIFLFWVFRGCLRKFEPYANKQINRPNQKQFDNDIYA